MRLFGHDAGVAEFRAARDSGRLQHAWLLAGPPGVGKAAFADMAALRLLAEAAGPAVNLPGIETPNAHPTARLIEAGSHPDFIRLERSPREDRPAELARNISIKQVRGLQRLFATTPSMSEWRAVVIDAADELERGAANALLKNLEEPPPKSVFLLVCHSPGRLLPTIRSRCRLLRFGRLDDDAMASVIRQSMPDLGEEEVAALVRSGDGAPGRALAHAGLDVAALDLAIAELIARGDRDNGLRSALASKLAAPSAQARYELFLERAPGAIAAHARGLNGRPLADAIMRWQEARELAGGAVRLSLDPQATVFELAGKLAALAENR